MVLQIIIAPILNEYSEEIPTFEWVKRSSWIMAVIRCVNFNPSPSQVQCLGPSVKVKEFGHIKVNNTEFISFKMSFSNWFLLTSAASLQGHKALLCPWQWCQRTTQPSETDTTETWRRMSYYFVSVSCHAAELQAILGTRAVSPASHKLHVYLSTRSFSNFIFIANESGWFPLTAPQSQDCNLHRIRLSTSWRQNPRLVLLVLAKCLSFSWRQGRGWVQLCKQPLTYSPLIHTKPQPIRFNSFSST